MSSLFALGADALAGQGQRSYIVVPFTNADSGGLVGGSGVDSEASRWETAKFPMVWTCAGGALGGGSAKRPPHWQSSGGGKVGGSAAYPMRFVVNGGCVAGGLARTAPEIPRTGGGVVSGTATYKYWFGIKVEGGGVVSGQAHYGRINRHNTAMRMRINKQSFKETITTKTFMRVDL